MAAKELKVFGETVLMPVSNIVNDDGTQWTPPTVSTELVNLGTLSTSGTLTADQATQIGTTTVGVTARASVNSVTRFYERVNISGTTATLVSADDDALHVLTVNLSTRAYTLSDVELGGGGSGPEIPTPTTSDNGKVLGVTNGAYALQEANPDIPTPTTSDNGKVLSVDSTGNYVLNAPSGGGGTQIYKHTISVINAEELQATCSFISYDATEYTTSNMIKPDRIVKVLSLTIYYSAGAQGCAAFNMTRSYIYYNVNTSPYVSSFEFTTLQSDTVTPL